MLRLLVLLLLLANAGYYTWRQGLLQPWGLAPASQSEPERLQQQLHPEALRLLPSGSTLPATPPAAPPAPMQAEAPAEPATPHPTSTPAPPVTAHAPSPPPEPTQCLQAGSFDERQAAALRQAAASLPTGSWQLEASTQSGRWMVYMGRFPDTDVVDKKRGELRALGIAFDRPGATWEPGLSLGRYSNEERAEVALKDLARQGVRTARVVQERPETRLYQLRLPAVTAAQRPQLATSLPLAGKPLKPC